MADDGRVCKVARSCIYSGTGLGGKAMCDFIGHTGRSRVKDDPKGKIVDGKCGYYEELTDEGKYLRGKTAWDSTF